MEDENELIALRRKKLETLRAKGIDPFGTGFDVSGAIAEVRERFKEGDAFRVAGRITAHRDMLISSARNAAFCICGESECATGSPNTPRRIGGAISRVTSDHFSRSASV